MRSASRCSRYSFDAPVSIVDRIRSPPSEAPATGSVPSGAAFLWTSAAGERDPDGHPLELRIELGRPGRNARPSTERAHRRGVRSAPVVRVQCVLHSRVVGEPQGAHQLRGVHPRHRPVVLHPPLHPDPHVVDLHTDEPKPAAADGDLIVRSRDQADEPGDGTLRERLRPRSAGRVDERPAAAEDAVWMQRPPRRISHRYATSPSSAPAHADTVSPRAARTPRAMRTAGATGITTSSPTNPGVSRALPWTRARTKRSVPRASMRSGTPAATSPQ